jgi:sialic acid synthase SpsE
MGIAAPIAATALGAGMIEKHFTLSNKLPGPDHKASLEPGELVDMTEAVHAVASMLGDGEKGPTESERKNIPVARRSLVAARPIKAGEIIDETSLTAKRPGTGLSPMKYWDLLGTVASKDFTADEVFEK